MSLDVPVLEDADPEGFPVPNVVQEGLDVEDEALDAALGGRDLSLNDDSVDV